MAFKPTNSEVALNQAIANLSIAMNECGAQIRHDPLPTVAADRVLTVQLFQNLISNAIKFRREEPPRIHVSAQRGEGEWIFSIRDNGIGIAPEHFGRVFGIFQRLHSRSAYPGSGIGLAICKKIVEGHSGRIWVESKLGGGSTFYFTIPITQ